MNFKSYDKELIDRIPIVDVGLAASILSDVFGVNSPVYLPYGVQRDLAYRGYQIPEDIRSGEIENYQIAVVEDEEADRMSQFGTPVLGSFTIKGGTYKVYDKRSGRLIDKEYADFEFPVATIVDFERPKNITKTPTIGSSGTVKEIFGFDDWRINIRGICLNDASRQAQQTAVEQQTALIQLNEIAGSLEIEKGKIFFEKYISRIVFENLRISAIQGKPGIIQYEIEAYSDEDILIIDV